MILGRAVAEHLQTLHQNFIPIAALFTVDHKSPFYNEESKQGIFYSESWAVMHYLMLGDNQKRQPQLRKFLSLTGAGKPIEEAFLEAFETDYTSFEKEVRDYVNRFSFPAIRFKLQSKIDFDREMQAETLTEAQTQYYLGDMLLHIGRTDAAEAELQKAIALDPSFGASYASMGFLRMRQGKRDEALQFLGRSVDADSKNYLAHYYYASLLQSVVGNKDKSQLAVMREHLKKAIELAPSYWPAYDMLGYVALVSREDLTKTEEVLKGALNSAPGKREIRLRLAEVMIANHETVAARVTVTPLKNITDDERVQQRAQSLLDEVQLLLDGEQMRRDYDDRRRAQEEQAKASAAARAAVRDEAPDGPPVMKRGETQPATETPADPPKPTLIRGGRQIEGSLLSIDCNQGMTLRVRVGNGNVELHSSDPSKIEFVSYTAAVSNSFSCGQVKTDTPVSIVYRTGSDPRFLGEPIRVEFTGKK
jgi:tetratricopeptide (TPR) repeat protein